MTLQGRGLVGLLLFQEPKTGFTQAEFVALHTCASASVVKKKLLSQQIFSLVIREAADAYKMKRGF